MSLNLTPQGERIHIGIFGRRNAGKSTIMNAITGQGMSIVSDIPGTTTDPVRKAMELLPLGPVMLIDTPGFDDEGVVGEKRVGKAYEALRKTDIAVLVIRAEDGFSEYEDEFIKELNDRKLPYIICINQIDTVEKEYVIQIKLNLASYSYKSNIVCVSALTGEGIEELKESIAKLGPMDNEKHLISDLLTKGDTVVLVIPIDDAAPKGRLILPQQQVLRDVIEAGCTAVVTREFELEETLQKLKEKPKVVVTDSQAFKVVSEIVPEDVELTSFSILMARYKGSLEWQLHGASKLEELVDGSKVLISEGCTHHRQCGDIGTVKLPNWINKYTGKKIDYTFTSGSEFPDDVSEYDLIVHCGGCMLNENEMKYRIKKARENGTPITNYGILIAYINGIVKRSLHLLTTQEK